MPLSKNSSPTWYVVEFVFICVGYKLYVVRAECSWMAVPSLRIFLPYKYVILFAVIWSCENFKSRMLYIMRRVLR